MLIYVGVFATGTLANSLIYHLREPAEPVDVDLNGVLHMFERVA